MRKPIQHREIWQAADSYLRLFTVGLAFAAALFSGACARPQDEANPKTGNWARCDGVDTEPDLRVRACTAIIQSGGAGTKDLAKAFSDRCGGHCDIHEYDLAIMDCNEALRLDPVNAAALNNRGNAYKAEAQYDRAIQDYDQAIKLDPTYPGAFSNRGAAYNGKGQYDRAIQDCTQAISLDPKSAVAFSNRGAAYSGKGQYDRAIQDFDRAISLGPKNAIAFSNRGTAYNDKAQYDRAIQDFDQAISLDPKLATAFNNRGNAYSARGQYDRAIQDFDQAISLDPKSATAFTSRGYAYYAEGQYNRAIQDFDQAIRFIPQFTESLNGRGYANFGLGRFAAAAGDFERSLTITDAQPYVVLWLHLARGRGGQEKGEDFKRSAAKLDLKTWPGPVVSFYLGQMTAQQVTKAAESADEKTQREHGCEAAFYLGEDAMLRHTIAKAIPLLRQARESCPKTFIEYGGAAAELKRLGIFSVLP